MIRLADYVISFLEQEGVKDIFVVPGGGAIFLNDALALNKNVNYYACHHEQTTAMAAEAYARMKQDIGVSLVTTGPGGTNTITGVAGSWIDSVPHLIISGQVFLNQTIRNTGVRQFGVQEINIVDIVKPITKYAIMIEDAQKIKYHLQKALYLAKTGRPGPVWLDIPANVQNAKIEESNLEEFIPALNDITISDSDAVLQEKVSQVIGLLKQSKRPLIHIGQGVRLAGAIIEMMTLIERYGIPVVSARNANDIVSSDHELYVGRPGTFAQRGANFVVQNADFYLAIGTRLSLPQTGYNSKDYARNAKRIMVDIDQAELDKDSLHLHLKIQADVKRFITLLSQQLQQETAKDDNLITAEQFRPWVIQCQTWKKKYPVVLPEYAQQTKLVNSYHFIDVLSDVLSADVVIVTDMGFAFQGIHQAFRVKQGQRLFTNSGFASMGWGLPAAIGACIAHDKKETICVAGEGGLQMNIQELAMILHHRFPIKLFVFNNGGYLTIKQSQESNFKGLIACNEQSGLSFPDLKIVAQSYNILFVRIVTSENLQQQIQDVVKITGPVICEIMMDPNQDQVCRFLPRKRADGTNELTPFEDLYPHLDKKEVEENMSIYKNYSEGHK